MPGVWGINASARWANVDEVISTLAPQSVTMYAASSTAKWVLTTV